MDMCCFFINQNGILKTTRKHRKELKSPAQTKRNHKTDPRTQVIIWNLETTDGSYVKKQHNSKYKCGFHWICVVFTVNYKYSN